MLTEKGNFIVNGNTRVVNVYENKKNKKIVTQEFLYRHF